MAETQKLTPQQRAQRFGAATRQHFQMIGQKEVSGGAQTVNFEIPQARILQSIKLYCEADINIKGSEGSITIDKLTPYSILRQVKVDFNNGFAPIVASGRQIALMDMLTPRPHMVYAAADDSTNCKCPASFTASTSGTSNKFSFMLDLPLSTNERDPVGLYLAQNKETVITLGVDVANGAEIINNKSDYTVDITSLKMKVGAYTFSVPSDPTAYPDMSVIKILDARASSFIQGQNYLRMPTGMIYRKFIFGFFKDDGTLMTSSEILSNIDIVFNTADTPYSIDPVMLRELNKQQLGVAMPDGVYFWDLSYQGFCNFGGTRDVIDTERITELAVRFNSANSGKLEIIGEKLTRLR